MAPQAQRTVFAIDAGATNWRLYRAQYQTDGPRVRLLGDPQPSPLTSFAERRLPAAIMLSGQGDGLESFGEVARGQLESETLRGRVREYFKPCLGAHSVLLTENPGEGVVQGVSNQYGEAVAHFPPTLTCDAVPVEGAHPLAAPEAWAPAAEGRIRGLSGG